MSLLILLSHVLGLFELKAYDLFSRYLNPARPSGGIVIVEVDQQSIDALSEQGISWPWPRQMYAPIVEYLSEADAVFMDILFTEPSSYGQEDDLILAEAFKKASNVYLPVFLSQKRGAISAQDEEFIKNISIKDAISQAPSFNSAITPIDVFKSSIAGSGNVTISPDEDGVYRRVPLLFGLNQYVVPNLVLSHVVRKDMAQIIQNSVYVGDTKVPLTDGKLLLRYYTQDNPFAVFSASQIINSYLDSNASTTPAVRRDFFKGRIVFVGFTAAGLYDLKPTSISSISAGVLIHATTLENILNGNFIKSVSVIFVIVFMLLICLIVSSSVLRSHSLVLNLSFFIVSLLTIVMLLAALFKASLYMNIIAPISSLVISFLISVAYSYATEGRQRLFLKATFSQYMDKKIADYIMENPSLIKPGGKVRRVTVFFADLAGFTSFAEIISPEKVATVLHRVLNALTEVLIGNQGVIDKYIGDSIMSFWGAPFDTDKDEINACRSAIECLEALREINIELMGEGLPELRIRIGIHSGHAIAGNIGSDRLFHYTVIGDTVNLASRLESANKFFKTSIIISEDTLKETGNSFFTRELGSIAVKGKLQPVKVFELMDEEQAADPNKRELVSLYRRGMDFYKGRKWHEAAEVFMEILKNYPDDGPSQFYRDRCEYILSNSHLTQDWDVIKFTEK
ncbi:MAG: CHASE2 domain-containing protein [Thermodesulfobacteriota bacterium]